MEALFRFLSRFASLFVFLLLEIGALLMIFNESYFQRSKLMAASLSMSSKVSGTINNVTSYFQLKTINEGLAEQNAVLQRQVATLQSQIDQIQADSLQLPVDTPLQVIAAKVVYSTTNRLNNYIVVDKGAKHGVKADMGVIDCYGVVGVVQSVSDNFSVVISALTTKLQISGKFKKNNYLCTVTWNGISPRQGEMSDIPLHVIPDVGDTIVTSGYSAIYPPNIPIGTVHSVSENTTTAWGDVVLDYAADFSAITFVNIIAYDKQNEQLKIERSLNDAR